MKDDLVIRAIRFRVQGLLRRGPRWVHRVTNPEHLHGALHTTHSEIAA